jgi:16S rRNA processing protein RimM
MRLIVARLGRAHGIRGEISAEVRTDAPERRFVLGRPLYASDSSRVLTLCSFREHRGGLLLGFEEIDGRTEAEALRGVLLEAEIDQEEEAGRDPDAWYDHQLVGLSVRSPDGNELGEIAAVEHPGAQDLLLVRRPDGVRRLVPFVTALVPVVDPDAGILVLDDPGGLLYDGDGPS